MRVGHPGYDARQRTLRAVTPAQPSRPEPASIRIAVAIACDELGTDEPTTSRLNDRFDALLNEEGFASIIGCFTSMSPWTAWKSWAGNGRRWLEAVLTGPDDENESEDAKAPIGWARLTFPQADGIGALDGSRFAELVLVIEPRTADHHPAPAAALRDWPELFAQALQIPSALNRWLSNDLCLVTIDSPATRWGIWLIPAAELVDVASFQMRPGAHIRPWFIGHAVADLDGRPAEATGQQLVRDMCDSTFHLHGYEEIFATEANERSS